MKEYDRWMRESVEEGRCGWVVGGKSCSWCLMDESGSGKWMSEGGDTWVRECGSGKWVRRMSDGVGRWVRECGSGGTGGVALGGSWDCGCLNLGQGVGREGGRGGGGREVWEGKEGGGS